MLSLEITGDLEAKLGEAATRRLRTVSPEKSTAFAVRSSIFARAATFKNIVHEIIL